MIHCANCLNCKIIKHSVNVSGKREITIYRCDCIKHQWRTPKNNKAAHKRLNTIKSLRKEGCLHYISMGNDIDNYLDSLNYESEKEKLKYEIFQI